MADGQVLDKVTIALPRGGVITGRISDDIGEPIADAQVQLVRYGFMRGGRQPMPVAHTDWTDDTGAFRLYGLAPGDYYVSARPGDRGQMMMPAGSLATGDSDQGFAPTYYPGTPSIVDAERITLAVGQEVAGISFNLTPTRLSRISGRVIGWTSTRGLGFISAMSEESTMMGSMMPPGQVQPEGDFEIRGVPPGRYLLQVQPRGPRNAEDLVGMTSVTVAGTDSGERHHFHAATGADPRPSGVRGRRALNDPARRSCGSSWSRSRRARARTSAVCRRSPTTSRSARGPASDRCWCGSAVSPGGT